MASPEDLRRIYSPAIFGNHFNERPQPDVLGRVTATPLEIQRAMRGEVEILPPQPAIHSKVRGEKTVSEWELLKRAREQRKKEARIRRNCGNGAI